MSDSFPSLSTTSRAFPLPSVSEDTLHYVLHLAPASSSPAALALLITHHVESLLPQPWLWNKDAWELKDVGEGKLEGRMRVGDAVDDEWCVVWLLREICKKWPELVISIRDNDGEFTLIEAAIELPSWVSPENAENRLWLHSGHLHLIPLSVRSPTTGRPRQPPDDGIAEGQYDLEAGLSEDDGVNAARTGRYRVDANVEQAVWDRIACYPGGFKTHQHKTKAWLPELVARALDHSPELIQKAVEGFYVRDPAQLRAASRMTHFPPSPSILSPVTMTRAAYAQLQGQVFHPPRVFGPEWHVKEGAALGNERRWRDVGVKIATGFEIMYREGGRKGRSGESGADSDGFKEDSAYKTYLASLRKAGFFGHELQGSEKWKKREEEAAQGWKTVKAADTVSQRPSFAFQVDRAVEASSSKPIAFLQTSTDSLEDSESWLEVAPDELDGMLTRAFGQTSAGGEGKKVEVGDEHGKALGDLAQKVEEFVGGQGDAQGARFVDELSDEDLDDSDNEAEELTQAEKDERLKNLVAPLPAEEWGRKTAPKDGDVHMSEASSSRAKVKGESGADQPVIMRPSLFAKQKYDGVDSESSDESDDDLPAPGTLGRKIAEMKWSEGAPRIEEIEDEEQVKRRPRKFGLGDDIDEQMQMKVWGNEDDGPEVVDGDMDVDMNGEEEEFLKFSRDQLGINDEMWEDILSSRRERGAYVPQLSAAKGQAGEWASASKTKGQSRPKVTETPPVQAKETRKEGETSMDLDSFDKVMAAMDAELAKIKGPSTSQSAASKSRVRFAGPLPSLPIEADLDDMDEDDLEAMDRELKAALKSAGVEDVDEDDVEQVGLLDEDARREYEMMKAFLESYKSQGGGSGVVGNLFGRLGGDR